jgi:hypothetical protein
MPQEVWHVMVVPGNHETPAEFAFVASEADVAIPLFPYLLPDRPDMALATMLTLALSCVKNLGHIAGEIDRLHIATGMPLDELQPQERPPFTSRFWLGFAVTLAR